MKTKSLVLTAMFIILSLFGYSQTIIGPMEGYNYAEVEQSGYILHREDPGSIIIYNTPGFKRTSIVLGIQVDQTIYKLVSITLIPSYTRKKLVDKVAPTFDLKYNIYSLSMMLNLEPLNNFKIGAGSAYNHLNGFNYQIGHDKQIENHFGYVISSSYQYKHFVLGLRYRKMKNYNIEVYPFIKSSKSFELSLSYMFSVFEK